MGGFETTFTPRVVDIDHGETVFAVDYRHTIFQRNLRRPVLTTGAGCVVRSAAFDAIPARALGGSIVADAINQVLEHGAEPVFAVVALWGLDSQRRAAALQGAVAACRDAGCSLAPPRGADADASAPGAAAFAVGVADQKRVIDASRVEPGDAVIGICADGFLPLDIEAAGEACGRFAASPPARVLARPVLGVLRSYRVKQPVHAGLAPALGILRGGEPPRLRSLGEALEAKLGRGLAFAMAAPAEVPPALAAFWRGEEAAAALARPSCGIGLVLVVAPHFAHSIEDALRRQGTTTVLLGSIEQGSSSR